MYKKVWLGLLTAAMVAGLTACGSKAAEETTAKAAGDSVDGEVTIHLMMSNSQELGVSAEQATEACREIGEAWAQIAMTIEAMAPAFCRWIRKVAAEVEAQHEMETALRWASVDNRPLYNRYRHTKKKRIRKKYAKRILEWYRTEVAPC